MVFVVLLGLIAFVVCVVLVGLVAPKDEVLKRILLAGFVGKLIGTWSNYTFTKAAFGDLRDVDAYHRAAIGFASQISRSNLWPTDYQASLEGPTGNVAGALGWFYWMTGASVEVAYLGFSVLSYFGALMIVLAARRAVPNLLVHRYAAIVMLTPSMMFHPSIVGKDAWMVFALGCVSLGLSYLVSNGRIAVATTLIVVGMALVNFVRPHIAAVLLIALAGTILVSSDLRLHRLARLAVAVVLVVGGLGYLSALLESKGSDGVLELLALTAENTQAGGSEFETRSIASPIGFGIGVVTVIFRPFIHETAGIAQLATALEGVGLAGFVILASKRLRRAPSLLLSSSFGRFCFLYAVGMIPLLATISNFGTLARQRAQIWPFLLIVFCLGTTPVARASRPSHERSYVQ